MSVTDLRAILEVNIPGSGVVSPVDALDKAYKMKIIEARRTIIGSLKGLQLQINTQELFMHVKASQLNEILYDREEIDMEELTRALHEIG
jgi:hypothetical protein